MTTLQTRFIMMLRDKGLINDPNSQSRDEIASAEIDLRYYHAYFAVNHL